MDKIHKHQKEILMQLLFHPHISFTEMNIEGLTSDHFTYHIRSLIKVGYVEKDKKGKYVLTIKGKEYANTYDTDNKVIDKQPKYAVFLVAKKFEKGKEFLLIQRRLKEPYYGYQGFITGKVKFGELLEEAARRELLEETGYIGDFTLKGSHRDIVYTKDGNLLEDKVFHIFEITNCEGELTEKVEGGENYWLPEKDFEKLDKKYYNEDDLYEFSKRKGKFIEEEKYYVDVF
ncbi:MAG: NUDIX domain-containing protein [bacterium]